MKKTFDENVADAQEYMDGERFSAVTRLYSARQVAEQQGTLESGYPVARANAEAFYARLRELYSQGKSITTFGPYSPSQAVTMKRQGIEAIYLGGWATSAKGSIQEDPGPDLASYPLSQVPDEASSIVRALLSADKNQTYLRSRTRAKDLEGAPDPIDYSPFIIADADTGHGGDAHVRNLIRRFVEVGVTGYHIEDQRAGAKKCGHQGGKVLVGVDEQIKRLNAARFQLDVMGVPGIIVARTDAEAATLLDNNGDERDHPFILGATQSGVPSYKLTSLALQRVFYKAGATNFDGFRLYDVSDAEYAAADAWLERTGLKAEAEQAVKDTTGELDPIIEEKFDHLLDKLVERWETDAGLMTIGEAVLAALKANEEDGNDAPISDEEWTEFAKTASFWTVRAKARELGIEFYWDGDVARTPEGFYQIRGGLEYAIRKSLSVAPFADIIWMETASADVKYAQDFAKAMHAEFPEQMLAYNLSPSFNWDSTGMSDEEMRDFPKQIGAAGFVFNFITYGGHQVDGVAIEEFSTSLLHDGMLALAKVQRKLRLLESPYTTPQTHVGGPRMDAALAASSARTATTKAMGKGSTQVQHLAAIELPTKVLKGWIDTWCEVNGISEKLTVRLRPSREAADVLELSLLGEGGEEDKRANIVFAPATDRRERVILSVRDQNTFDESLRRKRLMSLMHLYLIRRYKVSTVHYLSPTEDNENQTRSMAEQGLFSDVNTEVGQIIVAKVDEAKVATLTDDSGSAMDDFIRKEK